MKIALAANPNCGKTTMYNALTGKNEKVGNWAGVTVEKKEHSLKKKFYKGFSNEEITIVDLPGAYSISPFTAEESVTSSFIKESNIDVIINIIDSTNLSRSLFFTTQLLELKIPVIIALNKTDLMNKKGNKINIKLLSKALNCPVIQTTTKSKKGLKELIKNAISIKNTEQKAPFCDKYSKTNIKSLIKESDKKRFEFVDDIVKNVEIKSNINSSENIQNKVDKILTNKWIGIPIFAGIMFCVFWISLSGPGLRLANFLVILLEYCKEFIAKILVDESGNLGLFSSIFVDGIIGGIIAVISFLPLVMVMYFLIALLEDCGYMSRVSVILDPIFKKVGLSGKSVIPFIMGTGCSIPGIMACRTIKDEKERKATAMITPFMPCGAKLPVISLFASVFFSNSSWVGAIMYFLGIGIILLSALLIKLLTGVKGKKSYFIIELPEYKAPSIPKAFKSMLSRGWSYVVKAGTIILICNFMIHIMQTFDWTFKVVDAENSILHDISTPFAYLIAPIIGIVSWQLTASFITGFIAKENVVGTLAVCFSITSFFDDELVLSSGASEVATIMGLTKIAGLAYLMFTLFSPPCFAAIGAMNSEIKDKKWFFAGIGLQFAMGYSISFLVFFFGSLFVGFPSTISPFMIILGWTIFVAIITTFVILIFKQNKKANKTIYSKAKV